MAELIKYFNKNYGNEYGNIDYPRTTIQIYQVYQVIKDLNLNDDALNDLLNGIELPKPKNNKEREMYSECVLGVSKNDYPHFFSEDSLMIYVDKMNLFENDDVVNDLCRIIHNSFYNYSTLDSFYSDFVSCFRNISETIIDDINYTEGLLMYVEEKFGDYPTTFYIETTSTYIYYNLIWSDIKWLIVYDIDEDSFEYNKHRLSNKFNMPS